MQPWLCRNSVVVMRCKSIILLSESMRLSRVRAEVIASSASRILDHTLPPEWHTQYWDMLEDVSQHVALLYPRMLQASLCADLRNGLCLKVCLIIALAAQVELHRMPGSYHDESRQKTLSVILEVISLAKGLKDDDYALLEPILGVSEYPILQARPLKCLRSASPLSRMPFVVTLIFSSMSPKRKPLAVQETRRHCQSLLPLPRS